MCHSWDTQGRWRGGQGKQFPPPFFLGIWPISQKVKPENVQTQAFLCDSLPVLVLPPKFLTNSNGPGCASASKSIWTKVKSAESLWL